MVDEVTVKTLELTAPRHSKRDAQTLHGQLASGQIFTAFNAEDCEAIWSELRTVDGVIPSLFTLFEDLKYLQACAGSMTHLVEPTPRHTVRKALDDIFHVPSQCVIQQAESSFSVQSGERSDYWDLAYRQLWLYAMRHYLAVPVRRRRRRRRRRRTFSWQRQGL
jgi:hypothetical protein